jgi:uncharacterized protein YuzE
MTHLKITFDKEARAAYVQLRQGGSIATTEQSACGEVNTDLDADRRIIGIEVLDVDSIESNQEQ